MLVTDKYDAMTDDELRSLPPAKTDAFLESLNELGFDEADMSQGELRLFDIIVAAHWAWEKQRKALVRLKTKRMTPQ
jgi:hypothetical protein